jgi:hypothetical protein
METEGELILINIQKASTYLLPINQDDMASFKA